MILKDFKVVKKSFLDFTKIKKSNIGADVANKNKSSRDTLC